MLRWALLVAAGAIAAVLAVAYWVLTGYRPLETSSVISVDAEYVDDKETYYVLWLTNTGRLPVRVTGLNLESNRTPLVRRTAARLGDRLEESRPFESFTLGRNDVEPVLVVGRFDNCEAYAPGTTTRREVQLVRYRVLGLVATEQEVELDRPIEVMAPRDEECPGRG